MPQSTKRISTRMNIDVMVLVMSLAMLGIGVAIGVIH